MSCTTLNVAKGADLHTEITLKDQNGNLINATLFSKLVVWVSHINGTFISKYSMNTGTGYLVLDMTNAATGKIAFDLLSVHTNASPDGILNYEVHGKLPDVTLPDDSVLDLISTGNYLCTIQKSKTGTTTLP